MSNDWEPNFQGWEEDKVELSDTTVETHSNSKGEYGVMVQHPDCAYSGAGAIFWTDPQHLYFRYDWGLWFPISTNDPENCETICKRRTATMLLCTLTTMKHYPIKVYHIDRLPEELFGNDVPCRSSEEPEPQADPTPEIHESAPDELDFVSNAMNAEGGILVTTSDATPLPVAIYEFKGHCICFTFFRETGDWLADEELCSGDKWPYWFGEASMRTSPSAVAASIREKIRHIIPSDIELDAVAVLNSKCSIVNESEYSSLWESRHVTVVRPDVLTGSCLSTVNDFLKSINGKTRPELTQYREKIDESLDDLPQQKLDT